MLSIDQFDYVDGCVEESQILCPGSVEEKAEESRSAMDFKKGLGVTSHAPLFVISALDASSSSKLGNILTIFRISKGWVHVWSDRTYSKIIIV